MVGEVILSFLPFGEYIKFFSGKQFQIGNKILKIDTDLKNFDSNGLTFPILSKHLSEKIRGTSINREYVYKINSNKYHVSFAPMKEVFEMLKKNMDAYFWTDEEIEKNIRIKR